MFQLKLSFTTNFRGNTPNKTGKNTYFPTYSGTGGSSVAMATIYGLKCDSKRKSMSSPITICVDFLAILLEQCVIYDEIWHVCNENMAQNKLGMKGLNNLYAHVTSLK